MRNRLFFPAVLFVLLLQAARVWCQQLTVQAGSRKQVVLARADIEALPRIKVTTGASGMSTTFEGVPLKAVGKSGSWFWGGSEGKTDGFMFAGGSC